MVLVIMAAGLGSRFGGLKQAEPVDENGNFLIDYSIFDALRAGAKKVVFILRSENFEYFKCTIGKRVEKHIPTEYVFQEKTDVLSALPELDCRTKPFGTAHAILGLKGKINENFAVINADDFYGKTSFLKLFDCLKILSGSEFCSVGFLAKNTLSATGPVKRGVCKVNCDYLQKIEECEIGFGSKKLMAKRLCDGFEFELSNGTPVSMNMFGFTPKIFEFLEADFPAFLNKLKSMPETEYFLPDVIQSAIANNRAKVKILKSEEHWMGLTYREDLPVVKSKLSKLVELGVYPQNLWK